MTTGATPYRSPLCAPEYTAADLQDWIESGEEMVAELGRIHDVFFVELPGGHGPQLTQPEALARVILEVAGEGA